MATKEPTKKKDDDKKSTDKMDVDDATAKADKEEGAELKSADMKAVEEIREHCRVIERSEVAREPRQVLRVLRQLTATRKLLNASVLYDTIIDTLPTGGVRVNGVSTRQLLLRYVKPHVPPPHQQLKPVPSESADLNTSMDVDTAGAPPKSPRQATTTASGKTVQRATGAQSATASALANKLIKSTAAPEIEGYVHILVLLWLRDIARADDAMECLHSLIARCEQHNRRSMDALLAKAYYYYTVLHIPSQKDIIGFLLGRLRMASLRGDTETQASLINCVLGSYLRQWKYSDAHKFFSKVTFPEGANNNEWARFVFYTGRIKAMVFEYAAAQQYLAQAIRKAPQKETCAVGFKQIANKFHIVVTLLIGEIPERTTFRQATLRKALLPYMHLTNAVRQGHLVKYMEVLKTHESTFTRDGTISLVARLKKNVVLTALKQMSVVYSRIRLADIQAKLQLDNIDDVQCIVGNAIRDRVIDAVVEWDRQAATADDAWFMRTREPVDVYATNEPHSQFHTRINFCLQLHNAVTKALRYPAAVKEESAETAEEQRRREQEELELAKELAEEEDDDF